MIDKSESRKRPKSLKDALAGKIPDEAIAIMPRAFDTVGSIAVLEVPKGLEKFEKDIAKALLETSPALETIAKKVGGHAGKFRRQKMKILAGKRTKTTIHTENGVRMKVHIENTYFSARLATERARIAALVKQGEDVLVMFSGIAPYPLNIAKAAKPDRIVGIEINPKSHDLAIENLALNKKISEKIELHCGDVRKIIPKLDQKFDRIIMPLPKDAEEFLDVALPVAKPGAELNVYIFCKEEEIASAGKKVVDICKSLGRDATLLKTVRCGQSGVREYRVCVDVVLDRNA